MSTITREFTKEQLIEHINGRKEFADECAADSTLHPERREYYELTAEALRIALASLEAKPMGAFHIADQQVGGTTDYIKDGEWPIDDGVIEVYAAPPAPVSVPDEEQCKPHPVMAVKGELGFLDHFDRIISERDEDIDIGQLGSGNYEALMIAALDAFRAAMLQGAGNSESQHAVKASPLLNSSVKYIELQHADTRVNADGNSPVIPDSWVLVPVEPTPDMREAYHRSQEEYEEVDGLWSPDHQWKAMLAAAPQKEVLGGR